MGIRKQAAKIVQEKRNRMGMSRLDFSKEIGVAERTLFSIEKGFIVRKATLNKALNYCGYKIVETIEKI